MIYWPGLHISFFSQELLIFIEKGHKISEESLIPVKWQKMNNTKPITHQKRLSFVEQTNT
jgi:hypothetical protein